MNNILFIKSVSQLACKISCLPRIYHIPTSLVSCQNLILHFNKKGNWGKLTNPIITQLRVADEKILEEMEKTGTDFEKYNELVTNGTNFTWNMKYKPLMIQRDT